MKRNVASIAFALVCAGVCSAQTAGTITTVAGSGARGYGGDGGPALNASFAQPYGVTTARETDGSVSLYVSDSFNNRVRKITADGRITTFAGSAVAGFASDGGPATSASLNINTGAAIGPDGNLYIADFNNQRIRRVDATGRITTIAGTGVSGYSGDGGPATAARLSMPMNLAFASDGTIYFADRDNHRIRRISPSGVISTFAGTGTVGSAGDGGPAASAQLRFPTGITVASDGVYICDWGNAKIRRVGLDGRISTIAGTGIIGYSGDNGPAVQAALNEPRNMIVVGDLLFIADSGNHRIRRVTLSDGRITTFAGTGTAGFSGDGGPASAAQITFPQSIALGSDGALYVADTDNNRIRRIASATAVTGGTVSLSSNRLTLSTPVNGPALPVYSVRVLSSDQALSFAATASTSSGGDWLRVNADASVTPAVLAIQIDPSTLEPGSYAGVVTVAAPQAGNGPQQLTVNLRVTGPRPSGRPDTAVIVTVAGNNVRAFAGDGGAATAASLNQPHGVAVGLLPDFTPILFVSDTFNHRIRRIDLGNGRIETVAGRAIAGFQLETEGAIATTTSFNVPAGLGTGADGQLLIADLNNNRLRKLDTVNRITTAAGTGAAGYSGEGNAIEKDLFLPIAVAVAPDGSRYIADRNNHRIRRVDAAGVMSTVAGNGSIGFSGDGGPATEAQLNYPSGIAVGPDGSLYVADWQNHRVRRIVPDGTISTVVGTGNPGFSGDGPGTECDLNEPNSLALDGQWLYISELKNQRIRRLDLASGALVTIAGTGAAGFGGDGGPATEARLNGPNALAVGPDGSVYVADTGNNRIRQIVFADREIQGATASLRLSSPQLQFRAVSGAPDPAPQSALITSSEGILNFAASSPGSPSWLSFSSEIGQTPANFEIRTSAQGLAPGTYRATLEFVSGSAINSPQNMEIVLVVAPPPTLLTAAPASLDFLSIQGADDPPAQQIRISASQPAPALVIQVSGGASWLVVERVSGSEPWDVAIRVRSLGLAPGFYATTLSLSGTEVASPLSVPVTLRVSPAPVAPTLAFDPSSLQFRALTEVASPAAQSVSLATTAGEISYSIAASSPGNWLSVSPATISPRPGAPATLTVRVNTAELLAGNYEGEVTVSSGGSVRARLPVQLLLAQNISPELTVDTPLVQLSAPSGVEVAQGQVIVRNPSPSVLPFRIVAKTADGSDWLTATPGDFDSASNGKPTMLNVRADASNLPPGTYTGTIELAAEQGGLTSQVVTVPVVFAVTGQATELLASQSAIGFSTRPGSSQIMDVSLVAVGNAPLPWTAQVTRGGGFLRLSQTSGTAVPKTPAQALDVTFNPAGLSAGEHHGEIQIQAAGAARPLVISVIGRVSSGPADPLPRPSSLAFVPRPDGSNPERRGVIIGNVAGASSFNTLAAPDNPAPGTNWLVVEQLGGAVSNFGVSVAFDGLPPGTYRANINFSFAGNAATQVQVLAVKPAAAAGDAGTGQRLAECTPSRMFPVFASAQPRFTVALGQPLQTEIVVVDDCGQLANEAAAASYFSNGEPSMSLAAVGDGRWAATWVPKINESGEVLLETLASDSARTIAPASVVVRAFLAGSIAGPVLAPTGAVRSIDGKPAEAIAPGSRIEIHGVRLVSGNRAASATLGGVPLEILSAEAGRIVAVVPAGFDGRGMQPLVVQTGEYQSAPWPIIVAEVWPVVASAGVSADGSIKLSVSGIAEAVAGGSFDQLRFDIDSKRCAVGEASADGSGVWNLKLANCQGDRSAAMQVTSGTGRARTHRFVRAAGKD